MFDRRLSSTLGIPEGCHATDTQHAGEVLRIYQRWESSTEDGVATVVATLADSSTVRGKIRRGQSLVGGESYIFDGCWKEHKRFGWQFQFSCATAQQQPVLPSLSRAAFAQYLVRHVPLVSEEVAEKIADRYGDDAVEVICHQWYRLSEDKLLPEEDARLASLELSRITDPQHRQALVRAGVILSLARTLDDRPRFPEGAAYQAVGTWGCLAPSVIERDPFRLLTAGVSGATWSACDALRRALGLRAGWKRATAAMLATLSSSGDGSTWQSMRTLMVDYRATVGAAAGSDGLREERRALARLARAGACALRMDDNLRGRVFVTHCRRERDEAIVVAQVRHRMEQRSAGVWPIDMVERLTDHQREQLERIRDSRVAVLTGGPGTGKTHCAAALIRAITSSGDKVVVCAPTGKAAVRIADKLAQAGLQHLVPTTIHRALLALPDADTVVVDEVSMADTWLLGELLRRCAHDARILLVGDQHQLPPVGHGAPLRDLLGAEVPAARLTEIHRNKGAIPFTCAKIKEGQKVQVVEGLDCYNEANNLIRYQPLSNDIEGIVGAVGACYDWLESVGKWDVYEHVQVICGRNATRRKLNSDIQLRLNPCGEEIGATYGRSPFTVGDRIISLANRDVNGSAERSRERIANGDMGTIVKFDRAQMVVELCAPWRMVKDFAPLRPGTKRVIMPTTTTTTAQPPGEDAEEEAGVWDLAYAVTGHKYQGSECPVVIVVLESGRIASREWLYTAISRAQELCILVGSQQALDAHVARPILLDRKTFVVEGIRGKEDT